MPTAFAAHLDRLGQRILEKTQHWPGVSRRAFLLFGLSVGMLNALVFYFEPQTTSGKIFNLYEAMAFAVLLGMVVVFNAVTFASHAFLVIVFLFINLISAINGGVNSPNMGWMPLIPILALMMFGPKEALAWLLAVLTAHLLQTVAVNQGWVNGVIDAQLFPVHHALASRLNVLCLLVLAVCLYDWMHSSKRREMAQRNADLEETRLALLQAQSHKDEFIASVGHELRTPMNAILGLNGVLLTELADQPTQHALVVHIRESTEQLLRVVNDILDISQLEAAQIHLHPTPCQLSALTATALQAVTPLAQDKGLRLQSSIDPAIPDWVMVDQQRLLQVLSQLLDNAVKFTPAGLIQLRLLHLEQGVRFEVEDSGIGISPARLHNVFSRFEHADIDTHRQYGGTGLGLAICDRLVRRAGGTIGVDQISPHGTLVWFEWPLQATTPPLMVLHPSPLDVTQVHHVLVVDDNAMNQLVVELMVHKVLPLAVVHKASSGADALALLATRTVDAVLMDMVMPEMDGIETTRRLRALPGLATLPVIGLTANSQSQDVAMCLAAGMVDVLMKPLEASALQGCLSRHLGGEHG
jgi:signal transduction histidine kinase/ActR/RegA family two-component response regulator